MRSTSIPKSMGLPIKEACEANGEPDHGRNRDSQWPSCTPKSGRCRSAASGLFLLDCNVEGNQPEDRQLTSRLYGGDERTRIRQELVLGVGGVKALKALGIDAGVLSLERRPQCVSVPLEVVRQRMEDDGLIV